MTKEKIGKALLLEIGTEEIPSGYIRPALEDLRGKAEEIFEKNMISIGEIKSYGAPRRLILHIAEVSTRQVDITISGPRKKVAYDDNGKPTSALLGFLKAKGVKLADIDKSQRAQRVSIIQKGAPTIKLLPKILPQLVKSIQFPKQMWWENPEVRFARPIRWILCLYDRKLVSFRLGDLKSNRLTYGHRDLGRRPIEVKDVDTYFKVLAKKKVCFDQEKRIASIKGEFKTVVRKAGTSDKLDEKLLNEVNYLLEHPKTFLGSFDKGYLGLPDEVLIASMSKYQRVFALRDRKGKLISKFLGVADSVKGDLPTIRKNYENILDARLKDSLFFYNEDMKVPFANRLDELKGLMFLEGLGSVYEKMERLKNLSDFIAEKMNLDEVNRRKVIEVAQLAKADLTTHMVGEFPSLQGVMGREYARAQGLDRAVAVGIYEHYLPRFSGDELPKTILGVVASISDKIDTVTGCFAMDEYPTGSFDPHALRRRATGVIQVIIAREIDLSLKDLIDKSIDCYIKQNKEHLSKGVFRERLEKFFKERFIAIAREKFRYDIVDAVCQIVSDNIYDAFKRIKELAAISKTETFEKARTVVERTHNILGGAKFEVGDVKVELFVEPLEKKLWKVYKDNRDKINRAIDAKNYRLTTKSYGEVFSEPIHIFFDKVLVNVPDRSLCHNRMALMKAINRLYTETVADLSKVVVVR